MSAALAVHGADKRLIYQPFAQFIEEYQDVLILFHVSVWNYHFQLNAWLDDMEGIGRNCFVIKFVQLCYALSQSYCYVFACFQKFASPCNLLSHEFIGRCFLVLVSQ